MKKFKHLPTILVMVLCIAVIAVGIYAIQPTHNTIKGNVTIGASNPAVNLTVYYVPNGVTVEDAVLNDANKIGTTKTARYGVELELTDSRLDFGMDYINEVDEVNAQTIAIKIENTSTQVLGAYFTDESDVTKVKTNLPLSTYSSSTSFTEENLVPGYAEADFSGYTQVPAKEGGANGEAIVTMSISLLDLPTIELYIEIDSILIIEEYDSTKSVNLETDAHLAVNVTQEDYTYSPTALSTTDTSVDAEVYQAGEGIYVGLVNMQYSDATAAALSSRNSNSYVKPLGVTALAAETVTFSFNYSVTAADGTVTSAQDLLTDEKINQDLAAIGIGTYNGIPGLMPDLMSGKTVQLTKGTDYTISGNTITITYAYADPLNFCIVHETSEGMKINISKTSESTNLSLMNIIDNTETSFTTLNSSMTIVSTDSNMQLSSDMYAGVIPMRAFKTSLALPSFNFAIMLNGYTYTAEIFYGAEYLMLVKGTYSSVMDLYAQAESMQPLIYETDFTISGTEIIFTDLSLADLDFTLVYMYPSIFIENGMMVCVWGGNGANAVSMIQKTTIPVYDEYVAMNGDGSFTYTFVEEPTEIAKDTEDNELDGYYVSISKIALRNIPDVESLSAAIISTDAPYESIFIMEQAMFDMAVGYGMTLADLSSVLGTDSSDIGMYVSGGYPTENGAEFEILETWLSEGNKSFVLIMIMKPENLTEELTRMVNLQLTLLTNINPLIYTLSSDGTYYSVSGLKASVESIKIPATYKDLPVKEISENAFANSSASSIDLSEATNLTTIGASAFSGCFALSSVTIPEKVTSIGTQAFYGCSALSSVTIPENVTIIGDQAFYNCTSLTEINYNATNLTTSIYPSSKIFCFAGKNREGITLNVGANVLSLPGHLFYGGGSSESSAKIKDVIFAENSVCTSIGDATFAFCPTLTSINIPASLTNIASSSLVYHSANNLESIVVEQGNTVYASVNGANALIKGTELILGCKNTIIPNTVTNIGAGAFSSCPGLTEITIPESVTNISGSAFSGCTGLTKITIPENVTSIGSSAFGGCSALTEINYNATKVTSSNQNIFSNAGTSGSGITVNIGSTVTLIPNNLFCVGSSNYAPKVTTLNIGENVTSIGSSAFYNCTALTSITIPENVTSIGSSAFYNCTTLTEINYNAKELTTALTSSSYIFNNAGTAGSGITVNIGASVTSIPANLFKNTSKIKIVNFAENGVCASIGHFAFEDCRGLTSIHIPASVTNMRQAFSGCSGLETITVDENNTVYKSVNDTAILTIDGTELVLGCKNTVIPEGVTSIGTQAFYGCTGLETINVPTSVTSIGSEAFRDCKGITSITIPSSVTAIEGYVFSGCTGLTSITIPSSVTAIGEYVFSGCTGLTSIVLSENITRIGIGSFGGCTRLTSIYIPASVTHLDGIAFYGCSGLETITVDENNTVYKSVNDTAILTIDGTELVLGCKNTVIPEGVTSIGYHAFSGCTGLTSITIPSSVTSIASNAFRECSGLTSIIIPEGVTSIGELAFFYCTNLTEITVLATTPPTLEYSGTISTALTTIYVPYGTIDAYKTATNWSSFASKFVELNEDGTKPTAE